MFSLFLYTFLTFESKLRKMYIHIVKSALCHAEIILLILIQSLITV